MSLSVTSFGNIKCQLYRTFTRTFVVRSEGRNMYPAYGTSKAPILATCVSIYDCCSTLRYYIIYRRLARAIYLAFCFAKGKCAELYLADIAMIFAIAQCTRSCPRFRACLRSTVTRGRAYIARIIRHSIFSNPSITRRILDERVAISNHALQSLQQQRCSSNKFTFAT